MAENPAVWGIEIGQSALKAIRLRYAEAAGQVIAIAFDYVPHAKILSQPDAVPHELIAQSLETFLSRNDLKGDLVAIAVPGSTALARFISLPPVEAGKVGDIVRYEARQQIPFALEDVVWDYQTIGKAVEESGYILGAEVGLFAMKREQVMQHLQPFLDHKIEVELVQIGSLAVYNFLCYDQMGLRADQDLVAQDAYTIALDMGTDNTALVITNGEKLWIRNVPIGGNHFTRALTKNMKLTFAKAEHLKCNATKSPDPRAVFQALRPVFNDYVSEIQRSIGYFSSVNRDARVSRVVGMGNGFKLAGLQKFLHQNLQCDVERVETFESLVGDMVLSAPLFQENIMSFVVPYGAALQALKLTHIHTSLLPSEIAIARTIRRKKPWAVVTAASLLLGLSLSTFGYSTVANSVSAERFGQAEQAAKEFTSKVSGFKSSYDQAVGQHAQLVEQGEKLLAPLRPTRYWMELYRAINECLPRDVGDQQDIEDITKRERINLTQIFATKTDDLSKWFEPLREQQRALMLPADLKNPPTGPGYVITLIGDHYHDEPDNFRKRGREYVRNTLLKNLAQPTLQQPNTPQPVPVRKLGITHATIITFQTDEVPYNPLGNQMAQARLMGPRGAIGPDGAMGAGGLMMGPDPGADLESEMLGAGYGAFGRGRAVGRPGVPRAKPGADAPDIKIIRRTSFVIQFVWRPTPPD
ncbi:MAG TPA: type IV pilus assembly protein PilM, partial [Planctomycetaceae bacterium]|nr:type IV pilus assembly protein PilM [Planctomycetaceae bacterium]